MVIYFFFLFLFKKQQHVFDGGENRIAQVSQNELPGEKREKD